jgi:hypothetical protein
LRLYFCGRRCKAGTPILTERVRSKCPYCHAPAFLGSTDEGKKLWALWGNFGDKEKQAQWLALKTPRLDRLLDQARAPARIHLIMGFLSTSSSGRKSTSVPGDVIYRFSKKEDLAGSAGPQ